MLNSILIGFMGLGGSELTIVLVVALLFFGGSTGLHYTNDLYEHNLCTNSWRKLTTTGRSPSPR